MNREFDLDRMIRIENDESQGEYEGHKPERNHQKQFTGWFIPAQVVYLFERGEINAKELLLLALIDSLVQRFETDQVIGCYASNKWLGGKIHISDPTSVSKMLSRLKNMGLLKVINKNEEDDYGRTIKRRYLHTTWKRIYNQ